MRTDPAAVAEYAQTQGYYAEGSGTDWEFMNQGLLLALACSPKCFLLDEGRMTTALDEGRPPDLRHGPGRLTDNGHFIVVTGYTGQGFTIRDPNSPRRSAQVWSFDQPQRADQEYLGFFQGIIPVHKGDCRRRCALSGRACVAFLKTDGFFWYETKKQE